MKKFIAVHFDMFNGIFVVTVNRTQGPTKVCIWYLLDNLCVIHKKKKKDEVEIAELEDSNQVWKRILQSLPAGQLSFLLRAGTDTLPTPLETKNRSQLSPLWPQTTHHSPHLL